MAVKGLKFSESILTSSAMEEILTCGFVANAPYRKLADPAPMQAHDGCALLQPLKDNGKELDAV
jgi:hypothetical protein